MVKLYFGYGGQCKSLVLGLKDSLMYWVWRAVSHYCFVEGGEYQYLVLEEMAIFVVGMEDSATLLSWLWRTVSHSFFGYEGRLHNFVLGMEEVSQSHLCVFLGNN